MWLRTCFHSCEILKLLAGFKVEFSYFSDFPVEYYLFRLPVSSLIRIIVIVMPATVMLGKGWHIWLGLHEITLWVIKSSVLASVA